MGKRKDLRYWNVPVTGPLDRAVEEILERGVYSTKADLIREAVREKLEKMRVNARRQFRRMLEDLAGKRGRSTELISVYITPDFDLAKVIQQLQDEQETAANIKSKMTRKNVIGALERIVQFLRTYSGTHRCPPAHGMAIFCGNVAGGGDIADIQLYWVEPLEPITVRMYRCDQEFVLEPLQRML